MFLSSVGHTGGPPTELIDIDKDVNYLEPRFLAFLNLAYGRN